MKKIWYVLIMLALGSELLISQNEQLDKKTWAEYGRNAYQSGKSHIQRHWKKYVAGAAAVGTAAYLNRRRLSNNQSTLFNSNHSNTDLSLFEPKAKDFSMSDERAYIERRQAQKKKEARETAAAQELKKETESYGKKVPAVVRQGRNKIRTFTDNFINNWKTGYNNRNERQANTRRSYTYQTDPIQTLNKDMFNPRGNDFKPGQLQLSQDEVRFEKQFLDRRPTNEKFRKSYDETVKAHEQMKRFISRQNNRNFYKENPFAPNAAHYNDYLD